MDMKLTGRNAFKVMWFSQAASLALLGFSITITYVISNLFGGVLVDRWQVR